MNSFLKLASVAMITALSFATPIYAQDTTEAPTETAPDGLALGETVAEDDTIGKTYTKETHGDWELRCIKTQDGKDPCQLYQLLSDEQGNSVAEISMFGLPEGQQAVAGATIATPLETLLTQQVTLAVDSAAGKRYPFSYCSLQGCFARIGLTTADIDAFKRGNAASMAIAPLASPDTKVNLTISLKGFTAGFAAVQAANAANAN